MPTVKPDLKSGLLIECQLVQRFLRGLVRGFDERIARASKERRQRLFTGLNVMADRIKQDIDLLLLGYANYMTPQLFAALHDLRDSSLVWVCSSRLDDFGHFLGITVCSSDPDRVPFLDAARSAGDAQEWVVSRAISTIEAELTAIQALAPERSFKNLPGQLEYMSIALSVMYRLIGGHEPDFRKPSASASVAHVERADPGNLNSAEDGISAS